MPLLIEISVRKKRDKINCDAGEHDLALGDKVLVESEHGLEAGVVVRKERFVNDDARPDGKVIRRLNADDDIRLADNRHNECRVVKLIAQKIEDSEIEMRLSAIEYNFDRSKLFVYYTAENRVDFREFIKSLGHTLKTRIQMVQIGVRDETKMFGGLGVCGRVFCCASHMAGFGSISIDMAKHQDITLNMQKLSGHCGRLLCCLAHEDKFYVEEKKKYPRAGAHVVTPEGSAASLSCNYLTATVTVRLAEGAVKTFKLSEIKF
ncbi:MAG: regulatory iron-sulfur-containing complex subunit RicT [Endomicrobiia bacterium]|nr:regulatory iron-sulfur-containing complex subunit RicT [Endomicrobiia bacterium]